MRLVPKARSARDVEWFRDRALAWGNANRRSFPWRETSDPFRILVAELLLQRTRAEAAQHVYCELFDLWPDAGALASADIEQLHSILMPLGLAYRAPRLKALAEQVCEEEGCLRSPEGLRRLPGVGPYMVAATLAALGQRIASVDNVSARVYRRFFGLEAAAVVNSDAELWALVSECLPATEVQAWNWAVLDLAALVCRVNPRCGTCPLAERCAGFREGRVEPASTRAKH